MAIIEHDLNGPFIRSSRSATPEGQTETVYAVRVQYKSGDVEWWNPSPTPHSDAEVTDVSRTAYRHGGKDRPVVSVEQVSRTVTISASEWTERLDVQS